MFTQGIQFSYYLTCINFFMLKHNLSFLVSQFLKDIKSQENKFRFRQVLLLICFYCVPGATVLHAQWSSNPLGLTSGQHANIISDGTGGQIIAAFTGTSINVVKVNSTGVGQWGASIGSAFGQQVPVAMASDGAGGAFIAWIGSGNGLDIYAQRINASGVLQWTASGTHVCAAVGDQLDPTIVNDGEGGAIICWYDYRSGKGVYAQRVNAAGVTQWTSNGIVVTATTIGTSNEYGPPMVSNGAGEVTIAWTENRNGYSDIYSQRLNGLGLPQWAVGGVQITTAAGSGPALLNDGNGRTIIVWSGAGVRAQCINTSGAVQWSAGGEAVSPSSGRPFLSSDESGGALITWVSNGVRAQRINGQGIPQWTQDAVLCPGAYGPTFPMITRDGSGGCIVTWFDTRSGTTYQVFVQRVSASGIVQWTPNGISVYPQLTTQGYPTISSNGSHGAVIAWNSSPGGGTATLAQNVNSDGTLGQIPVAPVVTSFSPISGYTGTIVTITGTGFSTANAVKIGGNNVTSFSIINDATITATVDTGSTGRISVATVIGTDSSATEFAYNGFISIRNGNWSDVSTWLGGRIPLPGSTVTMDTNNVTINVPVVNTGTITSGDTLVISSNYTNSGTMNINGFLKISNGGIFNGNPPVYAGSSALLYGPNGTFSVGSEWTGNSTAATTGVPARIEMTDATVNMPAGDRGIAGQLILVRSTLNMNAAGGDLYLAGNYRGLDQGVFHSNGRALIFNGSLAQIKFQISTPLQLDKLVIDKPGGERLGCNNDLIVQTLVLNGVLEVGNLHVVRVLGDMTWISGYVLGNLARNIQPGSNTYTFPVGTISGYTPASFTFTNVTSGGDFLVISNDGKSSNYPTSFSNTKYLNRHWSASTNITFSSANARFDFLPGDIVGGALPGNLKAFKYNGSFNFPPVTDYSIIDTTYNFNNITSFSEFGAGVIESALPVTLLSFTGSPMPDNKSKLIWRTSSEINFSHFIVERSKNGVDFISIGNVAARGDNSVYLFEDALTTEITSYRLKIVDIDGKFTYSQTVRVNNTLWSTQLSTFPNPAQNSLVVSHAKAGQNAFIIITGMDGRQMTTQKVLKDENRTIIDLSRMQPGNYFVTYFNYGKTDSAAFSKL
jgi:hypothetical protein